MKCEWFCDSFDDNTSIYGLVRTNFHENEFCVANLSFTCNSTCSFKCDEDIDTNTACLYRSFTFWSFIILMSLGTVGFNVLNSISDAICCDVIGKFISA